MSCQFFGHYDFQKGLPCKSEAFSSRSRRHSGMNGGHRWKWRLTLTTRRAKPSMKSLNGSSINGPRKPVWPRKPIRGMRQPIARWSTRTRWQIPADLRPAFHQRIWAKSRRTAGVGQWKWPILSELGAWDSTRSESPEIRLKIKVNWSNSLGRKIKYGG